MYTVKEVSKQLKLSEHTIRFYTDKNLIPMLKRDKNNIRLFDEESINCLIAVKHLRDTGMSIEAIKEYINLCMKGNSTIKERKIIIMKQRNIAEKQLQEAKKRLDYLNKKVELYEKISEGIIDDTMNPRNWSNLNNN